MRVSSDFCVAPMGSESALSLFASLTEGDLGAESKLLILSAYNRTEEFTMWLRFAGLWAGVSAEALLLFVNVSDSGSYAFLIDQATQILQSKLPLILVEFVPPTFSAADSYRLSDDYQSLIRKLGASKIHPIVFDAGNTREEFNGCVYAKKAQIVSAAVCAGLGASSRVSAMSSISSSPCSAAGLFRPRVAAPSVPPDIAELVRTFGVNPDCPFFKAHYQADFSEMAMILP